MPGPIALTQECCKQPCDEPESIQVPGAAGAAGAAGEDGEDGISPVTNTTAQFLMPAEGANVTVAVGSSAGLVPGQTVFVQTAGTMEVVSKPGSTSVVLKNLENTASALYTSNAAPTTPIPSGSLLSPGGTQGNSGALSGAAGGDLESTYPNPRVAITTTKGDLIVNQNAAIAPRNTRLAVGTNGNVLRANSAQPTGLEYGAVNLAGGVNHITGALPIGNGGTGQTTANLGFNALSPVTTRGDLIYRNATVNARLAIGTNGQVLKTNGTDPSWGKILESNIDSTFKIGQRHTAIVGRFTVDLNLAPATDTPIPISHSRWVVRRVIIESASLSLAGSAARIGVYTAAGKLGQAIVTDPNSELTGLTTADKFDDLTLGATMSTDVVLTPGLQIFVHLSAAHGVAATLLMTIFGDDLAA